MNSRERVYAALRHQDVDRVPIFMWFHPETTKHLSELLEIPVNAVGDVMGNDIHQAWVNNNLAMEGIVHDRDGEFHMDDWGITWTRSYGFNQITHFPLKNKTKEEVLAYQFPIHKIDDFLKRMIPVMDTRDQFFVGCDVSPCAFELLWRLRGMDSVLLDMIEDPDFSQTMIDRCIDFSIFLAEAACDRYQLDWLWTGDDVASQQQMMFRPNMWRQMIRPGLQRLFDVGKSHHLFVAYHCCGSLRPIIPDLIEMGLNVLNPIQSNCPGMNASELNREFGKELTFMGGVDTQRLLPNGTVLEVREAIHQLLNQMEADRGGYILAASHTIPPETPDENIFAMYQEAGLSKEAIFDHAAQVRKKMIK